MKFCYPPPSNTCFFSMNISPSHVLPPSSTPPSLSNSLSPHFLHLSISMVKATSYNFFCTPHFPRSVVLLLENAQPIQMRPVKR